MLEPDPTSQTLPADEISSFCHFIPVPAPRRTHHTRPSPTASDDRTDRFGPNVPTDLGLPFRVVPGELPCTTGSIRSFLSTESSCAPAASRPTLHRSHRTSVPTVLPVTGPYGLARLFRSISAGRSNSTRPSPPSARSRPDAPSLSFPPTSSPFPQNASPNPSRLHGLSSPRADNLPPVGVNCFQYRRHEPHHRSIRTAPIRSSPLFPPIPSACPQPRRPATAARRMSAASWPAPARHTRRRERRADRTGSSAHPPQASDRPDPAFQHRPWPGVDATQPLR
jgi:hypothetical protein